MQLTLQLLSSRSTHPATAGLLGDALHLLAVGLEDAPVRARQDLRLKLLLLFGDVAARIGSSTSSSGVMAADLGDLLLGLAVAAEGLQPRTIRLLGGASSSHMSMPDIQVPPGAAPDSFNAPHPAHDNECLGICMRRLATCNC